MEFDKTSKHNDAGMNEKILRILFVRPRTVCLACNRKRNESVEFDTFIERRKPLHCRRCRTSNSSTRVHDATTIAVGSIL